MSELRTIVDRLDANFKQWQADYMPLDSQQLKDKLNEFEMLNMEGQMHSRELETLRTQ